MPQRYWGSSPDPIEPLKESHALRTMYYSILLVCSSPRLYLSPYPLIHILYNVSQSNNFTFTLMVPYGWPRAEI